MPLSGTLRRQPVVAVVVIAALVTTAAIVSGVVPSKRRVILYGDSLAVEARDYFSLAMQTGDEIEVMDRTFGGTAICDRLDQMRSDLRKFQPTAVVLEFVGNNLTRCMQGPNGPFTGADLVEKYRTDARIATEIFAGAGVRVFWIGGARVASVREFEFTGIRRVYEAEPSRLTFATPPADRVQYVDAGRALLEDGNYTTTLPCAPNEGFDEGCVNGRIPVRSPDGIHLCPTEFDREANRCPVYSGGAARFGFAMADAVRRGLDV